VNRFGRSRGLLQTFFFFSQKVFPGMKQIVGRNAETALDEKIQRGLPGWTQIEKRSAPQSIQVPQKFLQAIRKAICLRRKRGGALWTDRDRRRTCSPLMAAGVRRRRLPRY